MNCVNIFAKRVHDQTWHKHPCTTNLPFMDIFTVFPAASVKLKLQKSTGAFVPQTLQLSSTMVRC